MKPIVFDITKQLDGFNKIANQMPFIISKSINDIAFQHARQDASDEFKSRMESRDAYFSGKNAFRIKKSSKTNLTVSIYHFKEELGLQQYGGIEKAKGKYIAVPIRSNLAKFAGVAQNKKIPKRLTISTLMDKAPRNRSHPTYKTGGIKPFILKHGVYIRTWDGLRMIYSFVEEAKHMKKLFKMQRMIERTYNIHLEDYIDKQYKAILQK